MSHNPQVTYIPQLVYVQYESLSEQFPQSESRIELIKTLIKHHVACSNDINSVVHSLELL